MLTLRNVARTTNDIARADAHEVAAKAEFLYNCDPLFSLCVKLWEDNKKLALENRMMKDLLDDREKPRQELVEAELERIRECPTT